MDVPLGLRQQGENMASFNESKADYSLFTKSEGNSFTAMLIYVDNIIAIGNNEHDIKALKDTLLQQFRIKDLGNLKRLLGSRPNSFPIEEIHWEINLSHSDKA
ncbi:hypothetical protein L3X38_010088 [Prunus dulcis]|uniref:Reverse transcriptase Ty1/copia-type domain-containing protein n=1 Tax=Prunus dulcis TaxID=3755 RepID=A0AAD4WEW6_PRUDU|nr:hypothetical protein L3X38_010088 [Prunus dulcis]